MKKRYILIFILILILTGGIYTYKCNTKKLTEEEYMGRYAKEFNIDNSEESPELKYLLKELKGKNLVFSSEYHGVKQNVDMNYKLTSFLIDNWDLKYIFIERDRCTGDMADRYVQSGDERYLKYINSIYNDAGYYKKLHEKNKNLPEDKKLKIIGADSSVFVNDIYNYTDCISSLYLESLNEDTANKLKDYYNRIKDQAELNIYMPNKNAQGEMKDLLLEYKSYLNNIAGSDKEILSSAIENLTAAIDDCVNINHDYFTKMTPGTSEDPEFYKVRDEKTCENILYYKELYNIDKAYLHYGLNHVFQKQFNGTSFLASRLNESEEFKDKVYSINTLYLDGYAYKGGTMGFYTANDSMKKILENQKLKDKNLIVNLNRNNSPFKRTFTDTCFHFEGSIVPEFEDNEGATTDYFQSLIIINSPEAIEPVK